MLQKKASANCWTYIRFFSSPALFFLLTSVYFVTKLEDRVAGHANKALVVVVGEAYIYHTSSVS